jgi:hypothetical protein
VRHTFFNSFHLATLGILVLYAVLAGHTVAALVCVCAELATLAVAWRVPAVRHLVDEKLRELELRAAARERSALLGRMSDRHRAELARLEGVVDKIRESMRLRGAAADLAVDHCVSLLAMYVRLAIAHNASQGSVTAGELTSILHDMQSLELAKASAAAPIRALAERRLAVLQSRAHRWEQSRVDLEAISHQLALIGEVIRLTHAQWAAPIDPATVLVEIDGTVAELADAQSTMTELFELDIAVEPRALALGREAPRPELEGGEGEDEAADVA